MSLKRFTERDDLEKNKNLFVSGTALTASISFPLQFILAWPLVTNEYLVNTCAVHLVKNGNLYDTT